MADDLGFSDLGCYGGEIKTPHLDRLAKNGLRFTQFYNTARCWPSRAALLTGYYAQQVRRDALPGVKKTGGRGKRPDWAPLLPKVLKPHGYRSYHSGKWHIDGMPIANGFDRSYYLKDQGRFFNPQVHHKDDKKLPPIEKDSGYYGTTAIADHAIECLQEHAAKHKDAPFFHYLAFTAPHFPLHALPEDIARYKDTYTRGWEEIRDERWKRIRELGVLKGTLSAVERDLGPPYHFPDHLKILGPAEVNRPVPWDSLTEEQKIFQADKMAIHAAMIDRMDQEIGRVLDQLRSMKALENTFICFLSDNGASAEIMVRSDGHDPKAPRGSAASYLCLGPGWSTTSNTPFRRHKTWTHEGGIATPFIVSWPKGIKDRGSFRRMPGHIIDLFPTILELADVLAPSRPKKPGHSLAPSFKDHRRNPHDFLWWFHDGHKAVRMGSWKLVAAKDENWSLYNLAHDRAERADLSGLHPDKASQLEKKWNDALEGFRKLATSAE